MKPTGIEFAEACIAIKDRYYKYSEMDCQGFMERGLMKLGVNDKWRGSNHMWREALSWKGTVEECIAKYGEIPVGAWLFTVKFDGGERKRGYNDSEGNASHVGCYTGQGKGAVHSSISSGGTTEISFPHKLWTHVGLCKCLDYNNEPADTTTQIRAGLSQIHNIVESLMEAIG